MAKKNIVWGTVIVLLVLLCGYLLGVYVRKVREWNILEQEFNQKVEQLDEQLDQKEDEIDIVLDRASKAEKERDSFKDALEESDKRLAHWRKRAASKVEPITLEECKEYAVELEGNNSTLKKSLVSAENQIFDLKTAITFKDEYIDLQEDKIDILRDKNKALKRTVKKDKRTKIWTNILSGGGGLVIGVGLGKISN